jgi:3-oxoacyl-[acyl-carrier-protein] synthase-1
MAIAAFGSDRVAVCAGSCDNGSERSFAAHCAYFKNGAFPNDYELRFQGASYIAEYIAGKLNVTGPAFTISTACASSAGAIIKGAELLRAGLCDAVIAGGCDLVSDTVLLGFSSLEAVAAGLSNPFSKNRKGINLGEGAAFFLMSAQMGAQMGGNDDSGIELLGWGESSDAFHMTAPRADGTGAIAAMREALAGAGLESGDIDYINLHGTGTVLNDSMESIALSEIFSKQPAASSTKPVTGHTLGAAGAMELGICWMALNQQGKKLLPVHVWDHEADDSLPRLHLVVQGESAEKLNVCMSNSFAFGGCNVSLIIGKSR